tara:strand:+ start:220 stop:504 length:285 start_codon:yes stop_codon:yes gene_type:complete
MTTDEENTTMLECIAGLQRAALSANRGTIGRKLEHLRSCRQWRIQTCERLEGSGHIDPGVYRGHTLEDYTLTPKGWAAVGNVPLWVDLPPAIAA